MIDVEVFVISWTGQHENAARIAQICSDNGIDHQVIYSDRDENVVPSQDWIRVPDHHFFGQKFKRIIHEFKANTLLMITADATCPDWMELLGVCKSRFEQHPELGVWSPKVDYSYWSLENHSIERLGDTDLHRVPQTDSIVWAVRDKIVQRLRQFNYDGNNYGWGIDSTAAIICHAYSYWVAIDESVHVSHPKGTAYNVDTAMRHMQLFFTQLSPIEKAIKTKIDWQPKS